MKLLRLAVRNITGSAFRSGVVAASALLVAAFILLTTLLVRGTETSMRMAMDRLGADIVVVPTGAENKVSSALLMSVSTRFWMPEENLAKVAAIEGVQVATPQLYLSTMTDAPCCSVSDMFVVVFDPATDFMIQPWLDKKIGHGLGLHEAVGGTYVFTPENQEFIYMYGYSTTLVSTLEPTGSGLDQTMFITFDTAHAMAEQSKTLAIQPLEVPYGLISSIFVRLEPGASSTEVALRILKEVPGVTPLKSPDLFQAYRAKMSAMLSSIVAVLVITWVLAVVFIALVFSMAANERRREMGVLRAMGATRGFIFRSLALEAGVLALAGGVAGIILALLVVVLFRDLFVVSAGLPFILPAFPALLGQIGLGLLVTLTSVTLAAFIPAYRVSHQDPAAAMRE